MKNPAYLRRKIY